MELEFMELKFHKKCYYRALYGAIRLKKKTCMLKCHYRALKCHYKALKHHYRALKRHYRAPYGAIRLKKKTCMF